MVTLILSNLITVNNYQKILAVITLLIDIVSSIILLWRVIKSRKISNVSQYNIEVNEDNNSLT